MKDGHAQAFTLGTTIPAASVMDLAVGRDIKLLDLTDAARRPMKKINPGYTLGDDPDGHLSEAGQATCVIGYATHLVASASCRRTRSTR